MANPVQIDPAVADAAIPLAYDTPAAAGWQPVIRLMSAGVVAQGTCVVLIFMGELAQVFGGNSGRFRLGGVADLTAILVEVGRGGVGICLIRAGWLAFRNRASGRRLIGPLEVTITATSITPAVANV